MTLTIEVTPEVERELQAQAQPKGQSLPEYAARVLAETPRNNPLAFVEPVPAEAPPQASIEARLTALQELVAFANSLPDQRAAAGPGPLPDDAVADVYREREDAQLSIARAHKGRGL